MTKVQQERGGESNNLSQKKNYQNNKSHLKKKKF